VLADLPVAQVSSQALLSAADALRDGADALLLGDHGGARLQFPPSYRARLLTDAGLPAWPGINCRDRNRVAIEAELAACADAGVRGVHCVTGDHPALGDRPDAQPVFDCDSVDVARLAAAYGLAVSVAHAPTAPPVGQRVPRLLAKAVAGANVAVVDHCGGPDAVATAVAELRTAGFAGAVLVCVPVVFDAGGAVVLQSFAAGRLPVGYLERIVDAPDPAAAGAREAVRLAAELLAIPGVDGVNLSGGALGPDTEVPTAHRLAEVGRAIQALLPGPDHSVRPHPEVTAR
jgi:5,10-methylenetetrahydrofolate reductase